MRSPRYRNERIHAGSNFICYELPQQLAALSSTGPSLIWTELNTDSDGLAFRSHLYGATLRNRTLALAFRAPASQVPQPAAASGPIPANESILRTITVELRKQLFSHVMGDFVMDDLDSRKPYRRVIVTSSKTPFHDLNLSATEDSELLHLLSAFLTFRNINERIHEYLFGLCFFDFQRTGSVTDSFDTTQMAVDFFGHPGKIYRSVVPRIRVCVMHSDLEQEPEKFRAFMDWFSSSTTKKTITDIPYHITRRTAARLEVGPKSIKVPQFSILGLIGQELTVILVPSVDDAAEIVDKTRAMQRRTLETATRDGMKALERLIKDPYEAKYATRNPGHLAMLPLEVRVKIWNLFLDDLPKTYNIRRPPVVKYASDINRHMGIFSQQHAPRSFCITRQFRDELMAAYVQRTTFKLSLRGDHSMIDDFFARMGPDHCALIKHIDITTNLAWDGALWHERLYEAVRSIIQHCERSHATTIDTTKYHVDMASFAPSTFVPRSPSDHLRTTNPYAAAQKRQIAAHDLFLLPVHSFHCLPDGGLDPTLLRLHVTVKVAVPHTFFPVCQFAALGKYYNLVNAINGALAQTPQDFVGTAFQWKVLQPYTAVAGEQERAVDWEGMVRGGLNAWG